MWERPISNSRSMSYSGVSALGGGVWVGGWPVEHVQPRVDAGLPAPPRPDHVHASARSPLTRAEVGQ